MAINYFLSGLAFWGLGLAAYLQISREISLPLRKQMPWLAAFGFMAGLNGWVELFLVVDSSSEIQQILNIVSIVLQPATGLLLLIFGWKMLTRLTPLPSWVIFIPGVLIVPINFVIAYAATTFITPSPIDIPIDIWSRYLLYLPGSIMAGLGFLRQWKQQRMAGYLDVSNLMLGAGLAFLFEAAVVGLVVPVAPYGPASYYNYNRVASNAFIGENMDLLRPYGLSAWLDYNRVLEITGFPIQFWRMISAFFVTFFIIRGLNVFDATIRRHLQMLQLERDRAQDDAIEAQHTARITAENWSSVLVSIGRRVSELDNVDSILFYITEISRPLLDSDYIGLALMVGKQPQLELKCFSDATRTEILHSTIPVKNPIILDTVASSKAIRAAVDGTEYPFIDACPLIDRQPQALGVVPIYLDSIAIGALWIARFDARAYTETDLIWLDALADQVEIAVKHGVMTAQLQSLSIIEERSRIAREMHDSLAQILGYLNLQIQALEALHTQGNDLELREELHNMRAEVQAAHADVRENILSLRTTLASDKGLSNAIQEYLNEFSFQTGIKTQFLNDISGDLSLSAIAEIQLVCILKEALANVRKHARCRNVRVSINQIQNNKDLLVQMIVEDDGVGFTQLKKDLHFGLTTMEERANSVSGELIIKSTPGKGTQVICQLPGIQEVPLFQNTIDTGMN